MNPARTISAIAVMALVCSGAALGAQSPLPRHPSAIAFDSLRWHVPAGATHRHVLADSFVVYVASDSTLPLVNVVGHVRYGSLAQPSTLLGVGPLMCQLMRTGGTKRIPADSLDMVLDLFAISVSFSLSDDRIEFNCSFLAEYTDTAMSLLGQILFEPAFEQKRLDKEKGVALQAIAHRFDNPGPALSAAFAKSMYSASAASRLSSAKTVGAVTRADLSALHRTVFKRQQTLIGISGRFADSAMIVRLDRWAPRATDTLKSPRLAPVKPATPNRLLIAHKPISQSYVRMGLPMFQRPHPDYYACALLNHVLGGGSFSSRLNQSVRSDAGLTYSIYSDVGSNYTFPASFYVQFHTKTESTLEAIRLTLAEIERIRDKGVTAEELAAAKATMIDALPSMFRSKADIVEHYSWNEYYRRAPDHYVRYPDSVRAVSAEQVLQMARKYLHADSLVYTVVADTTALFANDTSSAFSLRRLSPRRTILADSIPALP